MTKKARKTGKELEWRVAELYRQMGARKVEHNIELVGNQIDVYVEMAIPDSGLHRIAVEVKDWSRKVGVGVANQFAAIAGLLRGQGLVEEGVVVSASGFTLQARKAAEAYGIRLLELADLEAVVTSARNGMGSGLACSSLPSLDFSLDPDTLCDRFRSARYVFEVYRALCWQDEQTRWGKRVANLRMLLTSQGLVEQDRVVPNDSRFARVAILCGIPRWWNVRVVMELASLDDGERDKAVQLYTWLSMLPFSAEYGGWGRMYNFDVRCGLQWYVRQQDSIEWRQVHQELATCWDRNKALLESQSDSEPQSDYDAREIWEYWLNVLYHNLCRTACLSPVLAEACRQLLEMDVDPERCLYCLKRLSEVIDDANLFHRDGGLERWAKDINDIAGALETCPRDEKGGVLVGHLQLLEKFWESLAEEGILDSFSDPHLRRLVWVRIGNLRLERGDDLEVALDAYREAGDGFVLGLVGQGKAYFRWGEYLEAIRCFDLVVEAEGPSFDEVLALRGRAYYLCGQWQDSLENFEHALDLHPDTGWVWLESAQVRQCLGDYEGAQRGFQEAIALGISEEPEMFAAYLGLAETSEKLEDYETAIEALSVLMGQISPEDEGTRIDLYSRRANLFASVGDEEMAAQDLELAAGLGE